MGIQRWAGNIQTRTQIIRMLNRGFPDGTYLDLDSQGCDKRKTGARHSKLREQNVLLNTSNASAQEEGLVGVQGGKAKKMNRAQTMKNLKCLILKAKEPLRHYKQGNDVSRGAF